MMISVLNYMIWSPSPEMFTIPGIDREVRWYGLLFALGFIFGQQVMYYIFKKEGRSAKDVDKLTIYMLVATVVGARLGHCLFYNPVYYFSHPLKFFAIWEGGLASHGATIGVIIGAYLYGLKKKFPFLWVIDKVAIIAVFIGIFIRFGNMMNSEIIGLPTGSDSGVVFARGLESELLERDKRIEKVSFEKGGKGQANRAGVVPITAHITYKRGVTPDTENIKTFFDYQLPILLTQRQSLSQHIYSVSPEAPLDYTLEQSRGKTIAKVSLLGIPRYPAQLYESIACVFMFLVLVYVWRRGHLRLKNGFIFGLCMTMLWSERFLVEFFKENQEPWEAVIPLNMGQWLSLPMFGIGVFLLIKYRGKKPSS